jgi:predicted PurR-regulated permease PerM
VAERILMVALLGILLLGCLYVLSPFFSAILWAAILVFASWPVHLRLRRFGLPPWLAALTMVLAATVLVLLPLAIALPGGGKDVMHLRLAIQAGLQNGLPAAPPWVARLPIAGTLLRDLWNSWADDINVMVAFFRPYFGTIIEEGLRLLLGIANGVAGFGFALFISFFFYLHGEKIGVWLVAALERVFGPQAARLRAVIGKTVRGTVYGILGNAIVQGLLVFCGLWLTAVPRAPLLGLIAGFLATLPIGAPLVWIPVMLWQIGIGETGHAIFLGLYGVIVVAGLDHVIRPYFIARGAQLPFLPTVLGVLGGAIGFGLLGVFLGPVLLGVGLSLLKEFAKGGKPYPNAMPVPPPPVHEPPRVTAG